GLSASGITASALGAPFAYKGGSYPGTGGTCAATLAPAATCNIVVTFSPTDPVISNATMTLDYNNGIAAAQAGRDIQGTGAGAAVLAFQDAPEYDYGTLATTTSATHQFVVENTGGVTAASLAGLTLTAPFSY